MKSSLKKQEFSTCWSTSIQIMSSDRLRRKAKAEAWLPKIGLCVWLEAWLSFIFGSWLLANRSVAGWGWTSTCSHFWRTQKILGNQRSARHCLQFTRARAQIDGESIFNWMTCLGRALLFTSPVATIQHVSHPLGRICALSRVQTSDERLVLHARAIRSLVVRSSSRWSAYAF